MAIGKMRKNDARAREFDFFFNYLKNPEALLSTILNNPTGCTVEIEGIIFEYGSIGRLMSSIKLPDTNIKADIEPAHIVHLDHLQPKRRQEVEEIYSLPSRSITGSQSKADILIIDRSGQPWFISSKDPSSKAKLGQVSGHQKYGWAELRGGHLMALPPGLVLGSGTRGNTVSLSDGAVAGRAGRDREFARLKNEQPALWRKIVEVSYELAYAQLRLFGLVIENDRSSFLDFVGRTLGGGLRDSPDFYLRIGDRLLPLEGILGAMSSDEVLVKTRMVSTADKHALLIDVHTNGQKYTLTRIEPSFEGSSDVSQTKGIIFHFQDSGTKNYKSLFASLIV